MAFPDGRRGGEERTPEPAERERKRAGSLQCWRMKWIWPWTSRTWVQHLRRCDKAKAVGTTELGVRAVRTDRTCISRVAGACRSDFIQLKGERGMGHGCESYYRPDMG